MSVFLAIFGPMSVFLAIFGHRWMAMVALGVTMLGRGVEGKVGLVMGWLITF